MSAYWFTFMIDGIGDPLTAQGITRALHERHALTARSDPAGMWLEIETDAAIEESTADEVVEVARTFGFEPRDRVGSSFIATTTADELRGRLKHEWLSRWATGLVFLLPALALHVLTPALAQGTLYIPHGIEALLVGWTIIAATWPIVYQGLLSIVSFRMTPDLFSTLLIVPTFGFGVWQTVAGWDDTVFHVTAYAIIAATGQRAVMWRAADARAEHAHLMVPATRPMGVTLLAAFILVWLDVTTAMAVMLAFPTMIGVLAVNRVSPGNMALFPVLGFIGLLILSPYVFGEELAARRIEAAFLFNVALTTWLGFATPVREGTRA